MVFIHSAYSVVLTVNARLKQCSGLSIFSVKAEETYLPASNFLMKTLVKL